jgi:hypothetical protein
MKERTLVLFCIALTTLALLRLPQPTRSEPVQTQAPTFTIDTCVVSSGQLIIGGRTPEPNAGKVVSVSKGTNILGSSQVRGDGTFRIQIDAPDEILDLVTVKLDQALQTCQPQSKRPPVSIDTSFVLNQTRYFIGGRTLETYAGTTVTISIGTAILATAQVGGNGTFRTEFTSSAGLREVTVKMGETLSSAFF